MPQPLLMVSDTNQIEFRLAKVGKNPFEERPALAMHCMKAIASWSQADACMLQLFIALFGGSRQKVSRVYLALGGQGPKGVAIDAVAREALLDADLKLFRAIMAVSKTCQKLRDTLAHTVWGYSPDLPQALLGIDQQHLMLDYHPREIGEFYNNIGLYKPNMLVYKEEDFSSTSEKCERLAIFILRFRRMIIYPSSGREQTFDQLCAKPEVAEKLSRRASEAQ